MTWTWLGIAVLILFVFFCYMGYRRGFVREAVSVVCVFLSMGIVWFINPYMDEFLRDSTPLYGMIQEGCTTFVSNQTNASGVLDQEMQTEAIDSLQLPDLLANVLKQNNTAETYRELAVNTFTDYLSGYLTQIATKGVSFLLSYLLASVLIKTAAYVLNLLASLPVIRGVNKAAGGVLGAAKCVFFVWLVMLFLTVLCNTGLGSIGLEMVKQDPILSFLYNQNILMKMVAGFY